MISSPDSVAGPEGQRSRADNVGVHDIFILVFTGLLDYGTYRIGTGNFFVFFVRNGRTSGKPSRHVSMTTADVQCTVF